MRGGSARWRPSHGPSQEGDLTWMGLVGPSNLSPNRTLPRRPPSAPSTRDLNGASFCPALKSGNMFVSWDAPTWSVGPVDLAAGLSWRTLPRHASIDGEMAPDALSTCRALRGATLPTVMMGCSENPRF